MVSSVIRNIIKSMLLAKKSYQHFSSQAKNCVGYFTNLEFDLMLILKADCGSFD